MRKSDSVRSNLEENDNMGKIELILLKMMMMNSLCRTTA